MKSKQIQRNMEKMGVPELNWHPVNVPFFCGCKKVFQEQQQIADRQKTIDRDFNLWVTRASQHNLEDCKSYIIS